jgi:hypothetical protein
MGGDFAMSVEYDRPGFDLSVRFFPSHIRVITYRSLCFTCDGGPHERTQFKDVISKRVSQLWFATHLLEHSGELKIQRQTFR